MLDDLLRSDLKLVICGSAAGRRSAAVGHYYAGPGNKFWRTLAATGLTPRLLLPFEYKLLLTFGIGLTDLVKAQSGGDKEIRFAKSQRDDLRTTILRYQPRYVCFNGKRAAKEFFGADAIEFGLWPTTIGATRLFVAPSTSAAANGSWDPSVWQDLAERVLGAEAAV